MSASSATSSSISRSRIAIFLLATLATAYLVYCHNTAPRVEEEGQQEGVIVGPGLHRSNAIHRRRRPNRTDDENVEGAQQRHSEDSDGDGDIIARPLGDSETVVDEQDHENWNWDEQPPSHRNGQNIVQLLFRVSEDATRRNAYTHRGCQCNSCGMLPIRGVRYRCSNCYDFDLCEACEAQGLHNKTHVFYKIRVPTSSYGSRQINPVWYPGEPDTSMKVLPRGIVTKLSKETGFERPELEAFWEQWTFMANTEWREDPDDLCLAMDRKTFNQCLVPPYGSRHAGPNLIYDRMFAFYDTNKDELISFPEFLHGLAYRKKKDKLRKIYEGYDINGDGFVDRKDFLRIFRSYYATYKQMDRDILEGMDDQVMNNTEAHQLVTGRQPLSGAFGREGRFPLALDPRISEGKSLGIDGDLEITDGRGVTSDSSNDFGSREDVIIDAAVREFQLRELDNLKAWDPTESNAYWIAMSNPPTTLTELQHDVLDGLIRNRRQNLTEPSTSRLRPINAETGSFLSNASTDDAMEERIWAPNIVTVEDVAAVCGSGIAISDAPRSSRPAIVEHAKKRLEDLKLARQANSVNQELHERWKRRQFYTDEEEGGVPPRDWKEEEDIPSLNGKTIETPKEPTPLSRPISPRSRSSSKVRFVEDTDDFETRSNASTTSRSVPERWGGMDIPDAEKDVGKEILYQVTQQAFNELLDPLFKQQEDFAVEALSTMESRNLHRPLFMNDTFQSCWVADLDEALTLLRKQRSDVLDMTKENQQMSQKEQHTLEAEMEEARQRPLSQLLTTSEYALAPETNSDSHGELPTVDEPTANGQANGYENLRSRSPNRTAPEFLGELGGTESLSSIANFLGISEEEVIRRLLWRPESVTAGPQGITGTHSHSAYASSSLSTPSTPRSLPQQLDMTFPQFRPNSLSSNATPEDPLNSLSSSHETTLDREANSSGAPNGGRNPCTTEDCRAIDGPSIEGVQHHGPDAERIPAMGDLGSPQRYSNSGSEAANCLLGALLRADDSPDQSRHDHPPQASHSCYATESASLDIWLPDLIPGPTQQLLRKRRADILMGMPAKMRAQFEAVDWMYLYRLRELDYVEKEAKERGGWGRLNFKEFEAILKNERGKGIRNMASEREGEKKKALMDYLGSWIEMCIP